MDALRFFHHGAVNGVTGYYHRVLLPNGSSILVDCGQFQGAEMSPDWRSNAQRLVLLSPWLACRRWW